jgi:hypothetical protein
MVCANIVGITFPHNVQTCSGMFVGVMDKLGTAC